MPCPAVRLTLSVSLLDRACWRHVPTCRQVWHTLNRLLGYLIHYRLAGLDLIFTEGDQLVNYVAVKLAPLRDLCHNLHLYVLSYALSAVDPFNHIEGGLQQTSTTPKSGTMRVSCYRRPLCVTSAI